MARPDLSRVPEFYHNYINQVIENDLKEAFRQQERHYYLFLSEIPEDKLNYSYAPGKWTIKEVLQHIIDAERIFACRALCFARKDPTPLPSFDENSYALHCKATNRSWQDLVGEFWAVRQATVALFNSFDQEQLEAGGTASGKSNYVLGIGFIIAGHANHHIKIIRERYLPSVAETA